MKSARELMMKNVVSLDENGSVREAVDLMNKHTVGAVVIQNGGVITGIFTERDVINKVLKSSIANLEELKVRDYMTSELMTTGPNQTCPKLVEMMNDKNIRHIPVVQGIDQDKVAGILSIKDLMMHTLTDVNETHEKLKEANEENIQSNKMAGLGEIMAGVAHELKQPLNVTKITCQSILRDIEKDRFDLEEAKEELPEIINQVNRMSYIIDHMRVYTRHTEGEVYETINLNEVVDQTFLFLKAQLTTHNIKIKKSYSENLQPSVGDPIRLEQVLMNLIINAKHALESSGKEEKTIEVKTYASNDSVIVEIKDNGQGIPQEIRGGNIQVLLYHQRKRAGNRFGTLGIQKDH